ncbi:methyltransferase-like protein 23 isoform X1 [Dinothrombium tinctorium]|uniref:Methyltransferase-like protein 23 isoform X1 n=1 Tax=Dinothrombium tinctorium TaxID=1965070 RepID=A0A3S3PM31_9ACAR|nr:methyltransferase-like protein 23 isoform X1 [Dinothrombium tinctorium]
MFMWPCAPVLARFIFLQRQLFKDKNILELGAGTALPGIVAAKIGANVTLTDTHKNPDCIDLCKRNLTLNGLRFNDESENCVKVMHLTWGLFTKEVMELKPFDFIIASDCFYDINDFEDILATISFFIEKSVDRKAIFFTTYEERNADWNIQCLLKKWNLKCEYIEENEDSDSDSDKFSEETSNVSYNHSISLLKFWLQ